jgi:Flp pilus assembly protein TadG
MKWALMRLRRDERGASAVEFALLAPVLLLLLLGTVTLFDLFRTHQNVEKATFTLSDMLSREQTISRVKVDEMLTLMRNMVPAANTGGLRVSSIVRKSGTWTVRWSRSVGSAVPTTPIPASILPDIADGDSVLLTESFVPYRAFVDWFGVEFITFKGQSAHRPRMVSEIRYIP